VYSLEIKLKEIAIKNFLSYQNTTFKDLKNFNVLIGKNNSGKSNLFKIFTILKNGYESASFSKNFLFDENESESEIILRFTLANILRKKIFHILYRGNYLKEAFNRSENNKGYLKRGEWNNENKAVKWLIDNKFYQYLDLHIKYIPELNNIFITEISLYNGMLKKSQVLFSTNLENNKLNSKYLDLQKFINKHDSISEVFSEVPSTKVELGQTPYNNLFNNLHFFSKNSILQTLMKYISKGFFEAINYIPDKRRFDKDSSRENIGKTILNTNGINLVKFLHKKKTLNKNEWLERFNKKLQNYIPEIEKLGDTIDENTDNTVLISKEIGLDMELKFENFGAGILNIAYFIAFIMELDENAILYIEEPELFIFPGLQKLIREELIRSSSQRQIFITTHSPHFLSRDFHKTAIYLIKKDQNSSIAEKISEENILEVLTELDLHLYDYLLYDGILFVEGKNDLNVFKIISQELFIPNFKIIQCYGKRNIAYYAQADILHVLTDRDLNYLFLLDLDRDNENIWSKIQDPTLKKELEEHTLRLFSYELENIFLQPLLIIDFLFTHHKIHDFIMESRWIFEEIEQLFRDKGENNLTYLLKAFLDSYYGWIGGNEYQYIYGDSEHLNNINDIYNLWVNKLEEVLNANDTLCEIKFKEKAQVITKFEKIAEEYDKYYINKQFDKIISGKDVIKQLKENLQNKFRLAETISLNTLAIHLVNILKEYIVYSSKISEKKSEINLKKLFETSNQNDLPFQKEEITDFIRYLKKIQELLVGIQSELNCKFQMDFANLIDLNLDHIPYYFIERWNVGLDE